MILKREDIDKLELAADVKTNLLGLFDEIATKENEITELRAKTPKDTEKVVSSVDFEKYTAAVNDLDKLKQELAGKITNQGEHGMLAAFWSFFI